MLESDRFEQAFVYTHRLHRKQTRKGVPIPYIAHLMAVCGLVLENGGDEDTAIAALLHDAIEDQGGDATRQEIIRLFGAHVAEIVEGCTDADTLPKPPWRGRKEAYLAHLEHAAPEVLLVSACDKVHNARSVLQDYRTHGEALWARFRGGREGTLWYYQALAESFLHTGPPALAQELSRVVAELISLTGYVS